jgi:CubicO group peptidase (beta-lactamase class C family)
MTIDIHGFCDSRFRPLKEAFAANFEAGLEVGASVAAFIHGLPVVDLWAGHADWKRTKPWEKDTIVQLFSTTKIPLILSFLMLVDRGLIDLDATVAAYWPEFAAGGKGHVTVREALSHRAGVPGFDPPVKFEELHDWDAMASNIAAQDHWFGGEGRVFYHFVTFGNVLGEIIRRVDGRLPSQFFREEVAEKAGMDLQMGLRSHGDVSRCAEVGYLTPPGTAFTADELYRRAAESVGVGEWRTWERFSAEIPAGNGYGNGRSIARLCAIFAGGGALDGVRYLSKAIVDEASTEQAFAIDDYLGGVSFGLGFGLDSGFFAGPTRTAFHWGGYGGSEGLMDQATGLSFGYAMNNLIVGDVEGGFVTSRLGRFFDAIKQISERI